MLPMMSKYYHTPVKEIGEPEVQEVFHHLLEGARLPGNENFNLPVWKWLTWFFQTALGHRVNLDHTPWLDSSLAVKIGNMKARQALLTFCQEIARERGKGIELFDAQTVLWFLRHMFNSPDAQIEFRTAGEEMLPETSLIIQRRKNGDL